MDDERDPPDSGARRSAGRFLLKCLVWAAACYALRGPIAQKLDGFKPNFFGTLIAALLAGCLVTAIGMFERPSCWRALRRLAAIAFMLVLCLALVWLSAVITWGHGP